MCFTAFAAKDSAVALCIPLPSRLKTAPFLAARQEIQLNAGKAAGTLSTTRQLMTKVSEGKYYYDPRFLGFEFTTFGGETAWERRVSCCERTACLR